MTQILWPSLEDGYRPESEAPRVVGRPAVLLIYGDQDKFTPPQHGQRLLRALGDAASAELCVVPGVDHTYAYRDAAETYAGRVVRFLDKALRGVPGVQAGIEQGAA